MTDHAEARTPKIQTVRMTIEVSGPSDRDAWEWGDAIARSIRAELNENDNAVFGPIAVECTEATYVR